MTKRPIYLLIASLFGCLLLPTPQVKAQTSTEAMVSLAGDTSTRFHSIFALSDGSWLIGGEARSLDWLPSGVVPETLSLPRTTNSASPKIAFILQLTSDLKTIQKAVRFPANTVQNVFRIKTNTPPGQPTGDIYISGSRQNESTTTGNFAGYYLAKLNANFLNGNSPTGLVFLYDVATRPIQCNNNLALQLMNGVNQYKAIQPWDVQSDGKIVFGQGHAYSASWASVNRLRADGINTDTVPFWPNHSVRVGSPIPQVNGLNAEVSNNDGITTIDSILFTNGNLGFSGRVKVDSIRNSTLVFKVNRRGSNLRSYKDEDFNTTLTDENGNPGRAGKYPEDFMYPSACADGTCTNDGTNPFTLYSTNFGNNDNATHRLGAIVIDKRTNDMYLGYSTLCTHPRAKLNNSDVETILLAMDSRGKTKWWNRLHKEDSTEGSPAAQEIDGLALDYGSNQLVVAGASLDSCLYNFWKGNEIVLNPEGNGFQNQFTGTVSSIRYSWLGKVNLSDGKIRFATYVGEYANNIGDAGTAFTDPVMNGWPNPNTANANLDNTRITGLDVAQNGDILVQGEGTRTITTAHAFQRIPKPGQGLAPINQFVRIYSPRLDSIRFSSSVGLVFEPNMASSSANLTLGTSSFSSNGIVSVGFANKVFGKLAVMGIPAFGDSLASRKRGFLARLAQICDTVETPTAINGGPAVSCEGGSYTFTTPNPNNQTFVWSYPKGWVGSDSAFSANTASITLKALAGAEAGVVSVVKKSRCAVSLPFGVPIAKPLPTSISINTNPTFTAASYSLPTNSAVWFVNGDTARRANGQPIRTSTLVFAQVVPALSLPDTLTAVLTNDCGTFVSNTIILTSVKSKIRNQAELVLSPNPAGKSTSIQFPEDFKPEAILVTDLAGKSHGIRHQITGKTTGVLQLNTLPSGIYTLQILGSNGVYNKRLIKE